MSESPKSPLEVLKALKPDLTNAVSFATFLAEAPPTSDRLVADLTIGDEHNPPVQFPIVALHCASESCDGSRRFGTGGEVRIYRGRMERVWAVYTCRNCGVATKTYSLLIQPNLLGGPHGRVIKVGEHPPFQPVIPSRVLALLGRDLDLFQKGLRCESQGLGVGAFAYYRRAVESNWQRIVEHVARVAERVGSEPADVERIRAAAREQQFTKAVGQLKDILPASLRLRGNHNPFTLLHSATSEGLHENDDAWCLARAGDVRNVLVELVGMIEAQLEENSALSASVARLLGRNPKTGEPERDP